MKTGSIKLMTSTGAEVSRSRREEGASRNSKKLRPLCMALLNRTK